MANINISFDNKNYPILETTLSAPLATLYQHLSTKMNGTGAKIELDNQLYNIDATKLSTATNAFVNYLGTIAGNGSKVVIGGVEYSVDSAKIADAIADLHTTFDTLSSGNEDPSGGGVDPETGEILDSWDQIIASVNDGTYSTKYAVGNYKPLNLGSEGVVNMQIAAFDADVKSNGSGNAHITWIAKETLATEHRMHVGKCSWAATEMREYLANDIWLLIPETVRNSIVLVDKTYYDASAQATLTCSDNLWIPSSREIGFTTEESSGVIYSELFTDNNSRRRLEQNGKYWASWWTRSNIYWGANMFCWISDGEGGNGYGSANPMGVVLCFCM